jgi:hypothetical protein
VEDLAASTARGPSRARRRSMTSSSGLRAREFTFTSVSDAV